MQDLPNSSLRTFVTVAERGGFTQAARVLGVTQPTVSQQIKKLEQVVGSSLIDRTQRQLTLTNAGTTLLDYAKRIVSLNDQAITSLAKPSVTGKLRLGIPHEFTLSILPELVGAFSQTHPNVVVEVDCELSKTLLANASDYDLVIALHERGDTGGTRLRSEPLAWVSSLDFRLDSTQPLRVVAAPEPCLYRKNLVRTLSGYKSGWKLQLTSTSYSAVCAAVSTGMGVTILAESVVPNALRIFTSDKLKAPGNVDLRLHWNKSTANAATKTFVEFVHGHFKRG